MLGSNVVVEGVDGMVKLVGRIDLDALGFGLGLCMWDASLH